MTHSQLDFPSRLSARAIIAGVFSASAVMTLCMALAGGFNLWTMDLWGLATYGTAFWIWAFVSWGISMFAGGYISSLASRSVTRVDGLLHGFVTWACTCVLTTIGIVTGGVFALTLPQATAPNILWGIFISNVVALVTSLYGAHQGIRIEKKAEHKEAREHLQRAA